jgi:hypothetical protein
MIWLLACALAFGKWTYPSPNNATFGPYSALRAQPDGAIVASYFAGDRMFTHEEATYDPKTLALRSATKHASCCGATWQGTVTRNDDGTYDITAGREGPDRSVYSEELKTYTLPPESLLITGAASLPWMIAQTHVSSVYAVRYDPIRVQPEVVSVAKLVPPSGVPKGDVALVVRNYNDQGPVEAYLWYDPCTYVVDAWGPDPDHVTLRSGI